MAGRFLSEDNFTCPVCMDIFKDPVILPCSHSLCRECQQRCWHSKQRNECPICRAVSSGPNPPVNLALRELCEAFQQHKIQEEEAAAAVAAAAEDPYVTVGDWASEEECCRQHRNNKLQLFCLDDNQPACLVCRDSKTHERHRFIPIDEAAQERKEELRVKLRTLQTRVQDFSLAKMTCHHTAEYIGVQAHHTENMLKQEFEKLHQFLREEEAERVAELREEEEQKRRMIMNEIEVMSREMTTLSAAIAAIEEGIDADDIPFLQNYNSTMERAECTLVYPDRDTGALINVAKHLGNLKFRVWQKMQKIVQYTPVVLDPNTAHPQLVLSEDLSCMRLGAEPRHLPDVPERFDQYACILAAEGFDSGTHCWDVEVGDVDTWFMGVMPASAKRKGWFTIQEEGLTLCHSDGEYRALSPSPSPSQPNTALTVRRKPRRIRVQLDWGRGTVTLSFSDPLSNTHLHTFTHGFTEQVFPYFMHSDLRILPAKVAVTVP